MHAATIRGRLLFLSPSSRCGYYSRAAIIRGAASIRINTVYSILAYTHVYIWRSFTEPPNLNLPIFLQWQFGVQSPNLIPTNISSYTVLSSATNLFPAKGRATYIVHVHVGSYVALIHVTRVCRLKSSLSNGNSPFLHVHVH